MYEFFVILVFFAIICVGALAGGILIFIFTHDKRNSPYEDDGEV
jgi:hypothetical protein